ncbi:MAG: 30S ribosomal protein S16 [Parcubacteria group bacterium Gr01-1014_56]|nr:MAG: 30S ribosomal protein S16 [Parcubacteria group bacterium Gr01-1014_56]
MLTIRLQRVGRKNDPSFRVILVESKRAAKTGNYQEMLGSYNPRTDRVELKAERIKHWIGMGATVSDTMHNILVSQKVIEGKKINVLPRKSPPKKEDTSSTAAITGATAATSASGDDVQVTESADSSTVDTATSTDSGASSDGGSGGGGGE